ncbi:breast cancer type 1 susceptibility protein isoform X1 [Pelodiscus sinensis]|uniref:breast cancer type 1 susceptibility protein isoform X1 n=2 Tax=Pelodiscus sinensis TaxID=13735 RepID=UPI003F6C19FB
MDSSVAAIGDVQSVLLAMQKNLECPICLELIKEPVSTKCDHIFCRFCMFKLLSKKKKGLAQCPLCKTEVTKRSLQENPRFKQLIEGLLETIHAFELDTGIKFLSSQDFSKNPVETNSADLLWKEDSIIQSKGYRNRQKGIKEQEKENPTLEALTAAQVAENMVRRSSLRNKRQKCESGKAVYIELGSDSSEDLFKKAGGPVGMGERESFQTPPQKGECEEDQKYAEKEHDKPQVAWTFKSGAGEILSSDILDECGFSEEDSKGTWNSIEDFEAAHVNVAEDHLKASNSEAKQCDRTANANSLLKEDMSLFHSAEETDAGKTEFSHRNEESGLALSSENHLGKSKETSNDVQHIGAVETCQADSNSLHEREPALKNLLQPKTPHNSPLNHVSGKRLKRSIQKVNEWFSKSNEILSSSSSQDAPAGTADAEEEDSSVSDRESCISEKTDARVNCMEVVVGCENDRSLSKSAVHSIEDKIFGKTYKRERKSTPPVYARQMLQSPKVEDVTADVKPSSNSRTNKLKRKRKTASDLQPEDFVKKREEKALNEHSEDVNQCFVVRNAGRKKDGEVSTVNRSPVGGKNEDNISAELPLREGESILKNNTEKVTCNSTDGEPAQNICNQKSTKKMRSSLTKQSRHSARPMCALQLVAERNLDCPDQAELQIDSYPSSEEPRKIASEQKQVRRSRRLQLQTEKTVNNTKRRGEPNESARKHVRENKDSSPGLQRNVLVHATECKDPIEQQFVLNHSIPLSGTGLKGSDLETDKTHPNLDDSSTDIQTGKGLLCAELSGENLNACSVVLATDLQVSETPGSHSLLQPPSTNVDHAACPAQNVSENNQPAASESEERPLYACSPKANQCCMESGLERFRNQKSHDTKSILELNTETEDSELDTQYLRNMFRQSKRLSFTLHPGKESVTESTASETLSKSGANCVEYRHNTRHSKNEPPYFTKTVGLDEICEREKPKICESARSISGHSPGTHFSSDTKCGHVINDGKNISQIPEQVQLFSPPRAATAKIKNRSRLKKRKQPKEKRVSPEMLMESQISHNLSKSDENIGAQSNIEEQIIQRTNLRTINEAGSGSGSNQRIEAENKGPVLNLQRVSPVVCCQSPAELSSKVIEKNSCEEECKQVKSDKDQVSQNASIGVLECLISEEALEQPAEDTSGFPLLSETPDGLLCSAGDIKENTSICEIDRKEISAVFVKTGENSLLRDLDSGSSSSKSRSQNFVQEPRRLARKLQSSEEESSEDEELPCFQALIFHKSASTPSQLTKQNKSREVSSATSPEEILVLPNSSSGNNKAEQKTPGVLLRDACLPPSPESECSVDLFSSQSNMSEDSANRPQELNPVILAPCFKEMGSYNGNKEASPNGNEELAGRKTDLEDELQGNQNVEPNLGEASGYDSEASHLGDSSGLSSQSEILTTQQQDAMQNNLKKLQQEMAVLEAVLEEHGSQGFEFPPSSSERPPSRVEGTLTVGQMRPARGTTEVNLENHKISSSKGLSADGFHVMPSDHSNTQNKELEEEESLRSSDLLLSPPKSHRLKKTALEQGHRKAKTHSQEGTFQQVDEAGLLEQEAVKQYNPDRSEPENAAEQEFGTKLNSAAVPRGNESRTPNSSPLKCFGRLTHCQTAESTHHSAALWNINNGKSAQGCKRERSAFSSPPALRPAAGKENAKSPVVTCRRQMSIVASGLNQSELLLVQKFARKTQSTLSNQITEGTTHVIMKTDTELVCERTLKYFLGIAGRKWIVSYEWIVQSFKEGRILDEYDFEVRGDVINGRNHQGPRKARRSQTGTLFKDFEICCYGPFIDMHTGDLEWMVELGGASVVKQPHLFTHTANSTAVVVVQPDAWHENAGYRAIQQECDATVVTREWVLDSVACYECQELGTYLVSQS